MTPISTEISTLDYQWGLFEQNIHELCELDIKGQYKVESPTIISYIYDSALKLAEPLKNEDFLLWTERLQRKNGLSIRCKGAGDRSLDFSSFKKLSPEKRLFDVTILTPNLSNKQELTTVLDSIIRISNEALGWNIGRLQYKDILLNKQTHCLVVLDNEEEHREKKIIGFCFGTLFENRALAITSYGLVQQPNFPQKNLLERFFVTWSSENALSGVLDLMIVAVELQSLTFRQAKANGFLRHKFKFSNIAQKNSSFIIRKANPETKTSNFIDIYKKLEMGHLAFLKFYLSQLFKRYLYP